MRFRVTIAFLAIAALLPQAWGQESDEGRLIDTLKSGATVQEKDAACKRLKEIGTARAVPALAACLTDDALSHPARQALQCMPGPEAGEALMAALTQTSGMNLAGIIDSLGIRREVKAIPALSGLLSGSDTVVAASAARSLGRIGAADVVQPLEKALPGATGAVQAGVIDGLLRAAEQLRKDGDNKRTIAIAKSLFAGSTSSRCPGIVVPENARMAAYHLWILAASKHKKQSLVIAGITGKDPAAGKAALNLAVELPGKGATKALTKSLKETPPKTQVALLLALSQRGDPAACQGVTEAASSSDPAVRIAALNALADVGDAASVPALVDVAAGADEEEQKAARQTLGLLHHVGGWTVGSHLGVDVHVAMLALLEKAQPQAQVELVKALAVRRDKNAVPALFALAERADETVQTAAIRALGSLADESSVARLINLLIAAKSDVLRDATEDAIVAVAGLAEKRDAIADALLGVNKTSPAPVRVAALRAAARIDAARSLSALRAAVRDADAEVHKGAVRALAQLAGMDAINDLLALAGAASDESEGTIALRGYWRLAAAATDSPASARLELVRAGLAQARTSEDRKAGLNVLAGVPTKEALDCAEQACADDAIRAEAETAAYQIAARIFIVERSAAERVLRRLAAEAKDEHVRADAAGFKESLDQYADYVVPWLVSQPYRLEGKKAQDLFDVPLGPELPDGGGVAWSNMPAPTDATKFWQVDLSSVVGGNYCVVYLKTQVFWPHDGQVQLEMGSDDGIKLWVNGALVHGNNAVRGFTPAQDKATATLKKGWNAFLVKITQDSAGCAMAIRLHPADSATVQPLRVEAR